MTTPDPMGMPALYAPPRNGPTRATTGRVVWEENFDENILGLFNDGIGSAHIDHNIRFNGHPSVRLDPQGISGAANLTGGNQALTIGGSPVTITTTSASTLVTTSAATGSPAAFTFGYILMQSASGNPSTTDANSYVLTYASRVISGSANAWVVTFAGCNILPIPGTPNTTLTTTVGGPCNACNPQYHPTGSPQPSYMPVFKRRVNDQGGGNWGSELWWKPTSQQSATTATSLFVHRLYTRNGYTYFGGSVMTQFAIGMTRTVWANDYLLFWYATGSGTSGGGVIWVPLAFACGAYSQHSWDPVNGTFDRSGCWNFSKIIIDFTPGQAGSAGGTFGGSYVSFQFNETVYPLAGSVYQSTNDTGAKVMHSSAECGRTTTTRAFFNVAHMVGTNELWPAKASSTCPSSSPRRASPCPTRSPSPRRAPRGSSTSWAAPTACASTTTSPPRRAAGRSSLP